MKNKIFLLAQHLLTTSVLSQFTLENVNSIDAVTLYDSDDVETRKESARLTLKTAWSEFGYSHAKQYTLDFVMQIDTPEEMK